VDRAAARCILTVPDVSVVIPTFDRSDLLRRAVRTALAQQDVDLEVIVVDDGPHMPWTTDGLDSDPRVSVVRHERNRGMCAARNSGTASARGEWVAFLDDDDLWAPTKVRALLDAAAPDAGFAYSSAVVVDGVFHPLGIEAAPAPSELLPLLLQRCVMPGGTSNAMVRRTVLERAGGFDENLVMLGDWDLWIRLAQSAPASKTDELLVAYSHHPGNVSVAGEVGLLREFDVLAAKHAAAARSAGVSFDAHDFGLYVANRLFRGGRRLRGSRRYLVTGITHRDPHSVAKGIAALAWPTHATIGRRAPSARPDWLEAVAGDEGRRGASYG
jgi:hypothetical protein